MKIMEYIIYYAQPLSGLVIGLIIFLLSAYLHWKIEKRIKVEFALPISSRSISNPALKIVSSIGIALGGIMIILAIKFLSS